MKAATPQQYISHVASVAFCVVAFIMVVLAWLPEMVQTVFLLNLFIGMHRIREQFKTRKVNLTAQCQSVQQAAQLCALSSVWWISEPLIKLQDHPKDDSNPGA